MVVNLPPILPCKEGWSGLFRGGGCVATGAVSLIDMKVKLNQLYKVFYSY